MTVHVNSCSSCNNDNIRLLRECTYKQLQEFRRMTFSFEFRNVTYRNKIVSFSMHPQRSKKLQNRISLGRTPYLTPYLFALKFFGESSYQTAVLNSTIDPSRYSSAFMHFRVMKYRSVNNGKWAIKKLSESKWNIPKHHRILSRDSWLMHSNASCYYVLASWVLCMGALRWTKQMKYPNDWIFICSRKKMLLRFTA